jgi:hypothetical protein
MTFTFLKIIGIGFILSVSTLANATLIDNGDYTTDTESGLDWLDWTETVDMTQSEALTLFGGAGWRAATGAEARGLLGNFFDVDYVFHGGLRKSFVSGEIWNYEVRQISFAQLLGETGVLGEAGVSGGSYSVIEGVGAFGVDALNNGNYAQYLMAGTNEDTMGAPNFHAEYIGIALVKAAAVSEPATITLFALGFAGIVFARRRRY